MATKRHKGHKREGWREKLLTADGKRQGCLVNRKERKEHKRALAILLGRAGMPAAKGLPRRCSALQGGANREIHEKEN